MASRSQAAPQDSVTGGAGAPTSKPDSQPGHPITKVHQEVNMTRRTEFKGSSAARRRERLKSAAVNRGDLAREEAISSEVLHRPTLSRAQKQAKGSHFTPSCLEEATPIKFVAQDADWQRQEYKLQLERAAIVYSNEFGHKPLESGICLPDVALYAAGHRKSGQITAR